MTSDLREIIARMREASMFFHSKLDQDTSFDIVTASQAVQDAVAYLDGLVRQQR